MTSLNRHITRRDFLRATSYTGLGLALWNLGCSPKTEEPGVKPSILSQHKPSYDTKPTEFSNEASRAKVFLVKTDNRKDGVIRCLILLGPLGYAGKRVLVKPNFNTADPTPGSTHNDTLEQLLLQLQASNPASLAVGERSGPPLTEQVLKEKGIPELCKKMGASLINYDKLRPDDWVMFNREGLHWREGFPVARPVSDADVNVATCCLKTHAYGGNFSMSLKLAVGVVPRRRYQYMSELHSSVHMRKMIAEINLAYHPDFVLMDGVDVFVDGGPDQGTRKKGNVFLLSRDRVALDAVGLAVLKDLGSNKNIMETPVFKQEQIARAVELGLGVSSPSDIDLVSDDDEGKRYANRLERLLMKD